MGFRVLCERRASVAETLAPFHAGAARGRAIDARGTVDAIAARRQENLDELHRYAGTVLAGEAIQEVQRLARQFIDGRALLFAQRITDRRIVDGHADLLADDIFCMPDGPVVLDCLEFDDGLRYVVLYLGGGQSVILDGTWRDARQRERACELADETVSPIIEFTCSTPLDEASARIQNRSTTTTSDASPEIAAALATPDDRWYEGHPIDTRRPLPDSAAEAQEICCLAV